MKDYAISVESLSKKYAIGHNRSGGPTTFRDMLSDGAKALTRRLIKPRHTSSATREDFWALKDVSFGIEPGERVGIVGRNGAGKSTLLKILSRITEPSTGRIRIQGRVASLLEVGTGFHPELTGRENIYLNGAVLGMSRTEIKHKFDEIVDFSEVEKFLDTPVKRYSSGMYVRLAFAVAAHLEPEILIVDEVLAVGDSEFQKKCLGKMEDVSNSGRTILFVSHNMAIVTSLCERAVWLVEGQVRMQGDVKEVCNAYLVNGAETSGEVVLKVPPAGKPFWFSRLALLNADSKITSAMDVRQPFRIRLEYFASESLRELELSLRVTNAHGVPIFTTLRSHSLPNEIAVGHHICEVTVPALFLTPGTYSVSIAAFTINIGVVCHVQNLLTFDIEETGSNMALYKGHAYGAVLVDFPWQEVECAVQTP